MSKHEPGPWISRDRNGTPYVGPVSNEMFDVARVSGFSGPDARANAVLIAAAPELLEALQAILAADEMDHRTWESLCGASIATADAFALARSAIAKATKEGS